MVKAAPRPFAVYVNIHQRTSLPYWCGEVVGPLISKVLDRSYGSTSAHHGQGTCAALW